LDLLRKEIKDHDSSLAPTIGAVESVFPALDIIRRAGPPDRKREEIFTVVSTHLSSKVWHVRDIAARTICTLLLHDRWLADVIKLIESANSTNRFHGVLMSIKYLLERRLELNSTTASGESTSAMLSRNYFIKASLLTLLIEGIDSIFSVISADSRFSAYSSGCPEVRAAFEEVVNTGLQIISVQQQKYPLISSPLSPRATEDSGTDIWSETNESLNMPMLAALAKSALLRRALAIKAIRSITASGKLSHFETVMKETMNNDPDSACAALELLRLDYNPSDIGENDLSHFLKLLIKVSNESPSSPQVRSIVLERIAAVMDRLCALGKLESGSEALLNFQQLVKPSSRNGTPELTNVEIHISGYVILCDYISAKDEPTNGSSYALASRISTWAAMLCTLGQAENVSKCQHIFLLL
jgi:hypothetical protein